MTDLMLIEDPVVFSTPPDNYALISRNAISTDFAIIEDTTIFNTANQSMLLALDTGNGIEDAPQDSTIYGRSNGVWVRVPEYEPALDITSQLTLLNSFRQTALGLTTANEDRYLSVHDLLNMGMIRRTHGGFDYLVPNVDIVSTGPRALVIPPTPQNLKVVGGFGHIQLFWEPAKLEYTNHYATQIFRSTSSSRSSSNLIASVPLSYHYVDTTAILNTTYYYWIRFVNTEATYGPYTDSVSYAVAKIPTEVIKNSLVGSIDSSLLVQDLLTPIDQIYGIQESLIELDASLIASTRDSVEAIQQEALNRTDALLLEAAARGNDIASVTQIIADTEHSLVNRLDLVTSIFGEGFDTTAIWKFDAGTEGWTSTSGTTTQANGRLILPASTSTDAISPPFIVDGSLYSAVRIRIIKVGNPVWTGKLYYTTTFTPTFTEARVETIAEPIFFGGIANLNFELAGNNDWEISTITQLKLIAAASTDATNYFMLDWVKIGKASDNDSIAALATEVNLLTSAGQASADLITNLALQVRGTYPGTDIAYVNQGLLHDAVQFALEGDKALATKTEILQVGLRDTNESDGRLAGALGGWKQLARYTNFVKVQSDLNSVTVSKLELLEATMAGNTASIENIQTAYADANSALAQSLSTLSATVNNVAASVTTEQLARVNADTAEALLRSTLRADFESEKAGLTAKISGEITSQLGIVADDLGVAVSNINVVTGRIDNNDAAILDMSRVLLDVEGNINATRTIKLNVNSGGKFYAAGMGINLTNTSGTMQSEVVFLADTFRITQSSDGTLTQPFYVSNGNVYMDAAFIKNATITAAHIADATITDAQIANASISFAKISGNLQSDDYSAGVSGWKIAKGGLAEFNDIYARGNIQADSLKANTAMVSTLNVDGNAITINYYSTTALNTPTRLHSLQYIYSQAVMVVTMPADASGCVFIAQAFATGASSWGSQISVHLYKNGVAIDTRSSTIMEGAGTQVTFSFYVSSVTGTNTYSLAIQSSYSGRELDYWGASLICIGGKR